MKNITEHTGWLSRVRRLPSSRNGNPRFEVSILDDSGTGVTCATAPDSSPGYVVENFDGKRVVATVGSHYKRATLNSVRPAPAQ